MVQTYTRYQIIFVTSQWFTIRIFTSLFYHHFYITNDSWQVFYKVLTQPLFSNHPTLHLWREIVNHYLLLFVNANTNGYFRFDFYIPSINLVIEYDGEHHNEEYFIWSDDVKNKFLQKNNVGLKRLNKKHFYNLRKEIRKLVSKT